MGSTISRPDGLQSQLLCHVLAVRLWTSHLTSLCLRFLFSPMGMPKYLDNRRSLMHRCTNVAQKGAWHMVHAQGNGCSEICSRPSMAPHSSTLAWKIPWLEEHGRLQFMGSLRVGHDRATSLSLFTFMHWRRKWQPTPVFLPGESQGRGSLVGCRLGGRTESDTTEVT